MLQLEAGEGGSLVPRSEPFAQWLYKAGYAETFRQQLLAINWANPEDVYALVDFIKQQIEPPVIPQKKNIRQELFLDNVMPIPPNIIMSKCANTSSNAANMTKNLKNISKRIKGQISATNYRSYLVGL